MDLIYTPVYTYVILLLFEIILLTRTCKGYTTQINICFPHGSFTLPRNSSTLQVTSDIPVHTIAIESQGSTVHEVCCWKYCVHSTECVDTCKAAKPKINVTVSSVKFNITSEFYKNSGNASCTSHVQLKVLSYYCDIKKFETTELYSIAKSFYVTGEVAYSKCSHGNGVGCQETICQSNGTWLVPNDNCLLYYVNGMCSNESHAKTGMISRLPLSTPDVSPQPPIKGTVSTTPMRMLALPASSLSISSPGQELTKIGSLSSSFPVSLSFVFDGTSTIPDYGESSMYNTLEGNYNSMASVLITSSFYESELVIVTETDVPRYEATLSDNSENVSTKHNGELKTRTEYPSIITPTSTSFYHNASYLPNERSVAGRMVMSTILWPNSTLEDQSNLTTPGDVDIDDKPNADDKEDKPSSKVALGIVIGVFVVVVVVLLLMIFRVIYRSAVEDKDEDMPRATLAVNTEHHPSIEVESHQADNPLFISLSGDFSESTTDDDVSNGSDVSSKSQPKQIPQRPSAVSTNVDHRKNNRPRLSTVSTNVDPRAKKGPRLSTNGEPRTRMRTSRPTNVHQTTFTTNEMGCFKVSRLNGTDATNDKPSNNINGDIYAVSYKRKGSRR